MSIAAPVALTHDASNEASYEPGLGAEEFERLDAVGISVHLVYEGPHGH